MHVEMFKAIDWFMDNPLEIINAPYDNIEKMEKQGIAFSVFDEEGCIGCGGYLLWKDQEAEAWLRLDKRALKKPIAIIGAIREGYKILSNVFKGRVYCWVNDTWPEAQRLVKWFKFVKQEESKDINGKRYFLWELDDGNSVNDSGSGSECCGRHTASQHATPAGRGPSSDISV